MIINDRVLYTNGVGKGCNATILSVEPNGYLIITDKGVVSLAPEKQLCKINRESDSPYAFLVHKEPSTFAIMVKRVEHDLNYFNHEWRRVSTAVKDVTLTVGTETGYKHYEPVQQTLADVAGYYETHGYDKTTAKLIAESTMRAELFGDLNAVKYEMTAYNVGTEPLTSEPITFYWSREMSWSLQDKAVNRLAETEDGSSFLYELAEINKGLIL